ncbi:MAG: putative bifunctional diguanylate cyclase/phosphodiesterase [Myxococcota bacterium]
MEGHINTLLAKLRPFVIPPVFLDEEQTRRAGLVNTVTLTVMGIALLCGPLYALALGSTAILVPAGLMIAIGGWACQLNRRGHVHWAAGTVTATLFVTLSVCILAFGGLQSPLYSAYAACIVVAGLLLGGKSAMVVALLSILAGWGILTIGESGLLGSVPSGQTPDAIWAGANTVFAATGLLLMLSDNNIRDALDRLRRVRGALQDSEERYMLASRGANDGIWDWNLKKDTLYCSPRWRSMVGLDPVSEHVRFSDWLGRVHTDDQMRLTAQVDAHLSGVTEHLETEYRMRHEDGSFRWVLTRGLAVRNERGRAYRMAGSHADITDRKRIETEVRHRALHDTLTDMPNRSLFMERLKEAIARSQRIGETTFAVLFIDLDRFKIVNDSLGHLVGDELLIAASRRLSACLRPADLAARLGGDEFAVFIDAPQSDTVVDKVAQRLQSAISQPFRLDGRDLYVTCSIGIVMGLPSYQSATDVLRDADMAMYHAKEQGRAQHARFEPDMHTHLVDMLELETDLRHALERDELHVVYQPAIDMRSGAVHGFEALVRWNHPTRGPLSPGSFIPMAEETGLVVPVDRWVLRRACERMAQWRTTHPAAQLITISVNLSTRQFSRKDLLGTVQTVLEETGIPPCSLVLEITESALMSNLAQVSENMKGLWELGVGLAVDDFGTGYSSLSYLHRYPVNTLKIDRSFVSNMESDQDKETLVRTVIGMAESLNLHVVAEGVETPAQRDSLKGMNCDIVQGFHYSKPVDAETASDYLAGHCPWNATPNAEARTSS